MKYKKKPRIIMEMTLLSSASKVPSNIKHIYNDVDLSVVEIIIQAFLFACAYTAIYMTFTLL